MFQGYNMKEREREREREQKEKGVKMIP